MKPTQAVTVLIGAPFGAALVAAAVGAYRAFMRPTPHEPMGVLVIHLALGTVFGLAAGILIVALILFWRRGRVLQGQPWHTLLSVAAASGAAVSTVLGVLPDSAAGPVMTAAVVLAVPIAMVWIGSAKQTST